MISNQESKPCGQKTLTTVVVDDDLTVGAGEGLRDVDARLVEQDVGQGVIHVQLVLLQNDRLKKSFDALLESVNKVTIRSNSKRRTKITQVLSIKIGARVILAASGRRRV